MNWNKIWLVMRYEYIYNFKRKSFLFTAIVLPVIIVGAIYLVARLAINFETNLDDYKRVGYVDHADILPTMPDERFSRYQPYASEEEARAAFDADEIGAYFVLPARYMRGTEPIQFFAEDDMPEALREDFGEFVINHLATDIPGEPSVGLLLDPSDLQYRLLDEGEARDEEALIARQVLPFIFAFFIFMTVATTSQFLASSVVEEKENRMMEVLVLNVRPLQLIFGKFLGLGALALTQLALWVAAGFGIVIAVGYGHVLSEVDPGVGSLGLMALYFLLTFGLYAGLMVAVGAVVSAEQESRQLAAFVFLPMISPMWLLGPILENPTGGLATGMGLFPLTAGMTNLVVIGTGEARTWVIVSSLGLMILTTVVVLWLASKLFRAGMLLYGQRLTLKQITRALRG